LANTEIKTSPYDGVTFVEEWEGDLPRKEVPVYNIKTKLPEGCKTDELIILGMGSSRKECPFDCEVWGVNTGYTQVAELGGHIEKLFIAHTQVKHPTIEGAVVFDFLQVNELIDHGIEVFNIHRVKGSKARLLPLQRLIRKFKTDFYSDTMTYMIAYALDKCTEVIDGKIKLKADPPYRKLNLWGVDMMNRDEYQWEKGGVEFWIGYAMGLGMEVFICEGSQVCRNATGKPYGVKYFNWKDLDPYGLMRKRQRKIEKKTEKENTLKTAISDRGIVSVHK